MTTRAGAQIGRAPRGPDPTSPYSVGLSYGLFEVGTYTDGRSNTTWDFGWTTSIAATLEKSLSAGTAVGVEAAFASPRLNYNPVGAFGTCTFGCTAKADVTQFLATGRLGGGFLGIRSSFIVKAGATQFGNFRDATTDTKLSGMGGGWDPTFGTDYDFGVSLTPKTEMYFETGLLFVLHDSGNTVTTAPPTNYTIKIGVRQGF
ncbi:MAG TPA: hypothetical protein VGH04_14055 [Gemmatimonadaceae bacterium]